eukprot:g40425.t1
MIDERSGPVIYKIWVTEVVLNKHMDEMKAANSQIGQKQNIYGATEQPEMCSAPVGSLHGETLESDMDTVGVAASMPLPPEEEDEFLLTQYGSERRAMGQWTPVSEAVSEELDP